MPYISLNPATNKTLKTYTSWDSHHLATALEQTYNAQRAWAQTAFCDAGRTYEPRGHAAARAS